MKINFCFQLENVIDEAKTCQNIGRLMSFVQIGCQLFRIIHSNDVKRQRIDWRQIQIHTTRTAAFDSNRNMVIMNSQQVSSFCINDSTFNVISLSRFGRFVVAHLVFAAHRNIFPFLQKNERKITFKVNN